LRLSIYGVILLCILLMSSFQTNYAQNVDIAKLRVDSTPVASVRALVKDAVIIAYGWFDSASQIVPTGTVVASGELTNYVQSFHVKKLMKGQAGKMIKVLSTGIEPLPQPKDPLNKVYPGPTAEGNYICFFRLVPGTNQLYSIIGGWQGVYPVVNGKTISLESSGFPIFNNLTVAEMELKIRENMR
jgi:hypothetical protein